MDESESNRSQSPQSLFLATTIATLVLAGSAVLLRSKLAQFSFSVSHVAEDTEQRDATASNPSQGPSSKNARSKERRRRGKDPMKELMKGGKKAARLLKNIEQSEHTSAGPSSPSSPTATHTQQQSQQAGASRLSKRSTSPNPSASSRSVSSVSTSSSRQHVRSDADNQNDSEDDRMIDIPDEDLYNASVVSQDSQRPSRPGSHYIDPHYIYCTPSGSSTTSHSHSTSQESTPSLASLATNLSLTDSVATTSTAVTSVGSMSPSMSMKPYDYEEQEQNGGEQEDQEQRKTTPTRNNIPSSKSYPTKINNANDIHHPSRKPPRFRSRNNTASPQAEISASVSMPPMPSRNATLTPSSGTADLPEQHDAEMPVHVDFPTLNGSINNGSASSSRPRERTSSAVHVNEVDGQHNSDHGSMTRRASTPRRTPTPSSIPGSGNIPSNSSSGTGSPGPGSGRNTPPPSQSASSASSTVSTQTQIASLRGALEAARMREEKAKHDLERYVKELEMLRWESSVLRRRESELQTHVHHLMHQVQSYAAFYMSSAMSPPMMQSPPNGLHSQHLAVPGANGSPPGSNSGSNAPSPSLNHHQQVPLPASAPGTPGVQTSEHQQPQQSQQHLPQENVNGAHSDGLMSQAQMNGMPMSPVSPLGSMSPLSFSMVSSPHSPHFPYPPYPMPGQASHDPRRPPYGMPLQMHPSHFLSMMNVNPMSSSTSASSALSMTTAEDDISPDPSANNSPSPGPKNVLDRGRKKRKGLESSSLGDGWVGVGYSEDVEDEASASGSSERCDAEGEDDDDGIGSVNEMLADAILKRPGSIRLGSGRKKGSRPGKSRSEDDNSSSPSRSSPGTPGSSGSIQNSSSSESPVEFVFPSISNWGNVTKKKTEVTIEPTEEDSQIAQVVNTSPDVEKVEGDQITPTAASGSAQKDTLDMVAPAEPDAISLPEPVAGGQGESILEQ